MGRHWDEVNGPGWLCPCEQVDAIGGVVLEVMIGVAKCV